MAMKNIGAMAKGPNESPVAFAKGAATSGKTSRRPALAWKIGLARVATGISCQSQTIARVVKTRS